MKDPYRVLGVPRSADANAIKAAYYSLLKQYHPDKAGDDPAAVEKFLEIRAAWEVLDGQGRRRHDDWDQRRPDATDERRASRLEDGPIRSAFSSTATKAKSEPPADDDALQNLETSFFARFRYLAETLLLCAIAVMVGLLVLIFLG